MKEEMETRNGPERRSFTLRMEGGVTHHVSKEQMQQLVRSRIQHAKDAAGRSPRRHQDDNGGVATQSISDVLSDHDMNEQIESSRVSMMVEPHRSAGIDSSKERVVLVDNSSRQAPSSSPARQQQPPAPYSPSSPSSKVSSSSPSSPASLKSERSFTVKTEAEGERIFSPTELSSFVRSKMQTARDKATMAMTPRGGTISPVSMTPEIIRLHEEVRQFDDSVTGSSRKFSWSSLEDSSLQPSAGNGSEEITFSSEKTEVIKRKETHPSTQTSGYWSEGTTEGRHKIIHLEDEPEPPLGRDPPSGDYSNNPDAEETRRLSENRVEHKQNQLPIQNESYKSSEASRQEVLMTAIESLGRSEEDVVEDSIGGKHVQILKTYLPDPEDINMDSSKLHMLVSQEEIESTSSSIESFLRTAEDHGISPWLCAHGKPNQDVFQESLQQGTPEENPSSELFGSVEAENDPIVSFRSEEYSLSGGEISRPQEEGKRDTVYDREITDEHKMETDWAIDRMRQDQPESQSSLQTNKLFTLPSSLMEHGAAKEDAAYRNDMKTDLEARLSLAAREVLTNSRYERLSGGVDTKRVAAVSDCVHINPESRDKLSDFSVRAQAPPPPPTKDVRLSLRFSDWGEGETQEDLFPRKETPSHTVRVAQKEERGKESVSVHHILVHQEVQTFLCESELQGDDVENYEASENTAVVKQMANSSRLSANIILSEAHDSSDVPANWSGCQAMVNMEENTTDKSGSVERSSTVDNEIARDEKGPEKSEPDQPFDEAMNDSQVERESQLEEGGLSTVREKIGGRTEVSNNSHEDALIGWKYRHSSMTFAEAKGASPDAYITTPRTVVVLDEVERKPQQKREVELEQPLRKSISEDLDKQPASGHRTISANTGYQQEARTVNETSHIGNFRENEEEDEAIVAQAIDPPVSPTKRIAAVPPTSPSDMLAVPGLQPSTSEEPAKPRDPSGQFKFQNPQFSDTILSTTTSSETSSSGSSSSSGSLSSRIAIVPRDPSALSPLTFPSYLESEHEVDSSLDHRAKEARRRRGARRGRQQEDKTTRKPPRFQAREGWKGSPRAGRDGRPVSVSPDRSQNTYLCLFPVDKPSESSMSCTQLLRFLDLDGDDETNLNSHLKSYEKIETEDDLTFASLPEKTWIDKFADRLDAAADNFQHNGRNLIDGIAQKVEDTAFHINEVLVLSDTDDEYFQPRSVATNHNRATSFSFSAGVVTETDESNQGDYGFKRFQRRFPVR